MKVYKYIGPDILDKAFSDKEYCMFKCSYPKDFNDPYELFLTIDFQQGPEMLAYYKEVVGEIQQRPTSCFSKSPAVIPMWAHYAHNHCGVVIELDEEAVLDHLPNIAFGDIDYEDETSEDLLDLLHRAYSIGKSRYHYMLQKSVYSSAYYTKQTCWSYEKERRLVAPEEDILENNGMMLLNIPIDCITTLIVGHNATTETVEQVAGLAEEIGAEFYKLKIGKTKTSPHFIDISGFPNEFNGDSIVSSENSCESCGEPISPDMDFCSWCAIEQEHETFAAQNNPFRTLHRTGLLGEYYQSMNNVGKKH